MASISVGNQLYLYRLFVKEVGVGHQVMLSRIEEVLDADDIWPSDLGCSNTRELLEQLSDFVRLTVFKKGRVYATVIAQPEWDAVLERAGKEQAAPADKGGPRSWKRKKAKRDPKPTRPRPKGRPKPQDEVEATSAEAAGAEASEPKAAGAEASEPKAAGAEAAGAEASEPKASESATQPAATALEPEPKTAEPTANTQEQEAAAEQKPLNKPAATESPLPEAQPKTVIEPTTEPSIKFTIISQPEATEPEAAANNTEQPSMGSSPEPTHATESEPAPASEPEPPEDTPATAPVPTRASSPTPSPTTQSQLPQDFGSQVLVRNNELNMLYQILPLDQDPIALLDEDWRVARSTSDFTQQKGIVTFPLRYLATPNGKPVRVSMQRAGANATGKRWAVTAIDRVDDVGLEGLAQTNSEVMREFAQFGFLGPWDSVVQKLTDALAGAPLPLLANELRDYLCITFHRLRCENKVVAYEHNTRAVFDTGLLDATAHSILMDFHAREGDIPWEFDGFVSDDEVANYDVFPQPASYIANLCDIMILSEKDVRLSKAIVRAHGEGIANAIGASLRRIRRDYRLATPAYDPLTNEVRLLAPIEWPANTTQALVLRPSEDGFMASAVLSVEHASVYARTVSFELPRWLSQAKGILPIA